MKYNKDLNKLSSSLTPTRKEYSTGNKTLLMIVDCQKKVKNKKGQCCMSCLADLDLDNSCRLK